MTSAFMCIFHASEGPQLVNCEWVPLRKFFLVSINIVSFRLQHIRCHSKCFKSQTWKFFSFIQSSLKTNLYTSRGSIYLKTIHNIKSSYFLISQHRRTYFFKSSQNTEQETVYHPSSEYDLISQTIHKSIAMYWHSTAFGNPTFRVTQISKRIRGKITAA